jgi:hypothetical protein
MQFFLLIEHKRGAGGLDGQAFPKCPAGREAQQGFVWHISGAGPLGPHPPVYAVNPRSTPNLGRVWTKTVTHLVDTGISVDVGGGDGWE